MATLGDEIDNSDYSLINAAAKSSAAANLLQQPEHERILPAKVQLLNFLG